MNYAALYFDQHYQQNQVITFEAADDASALSIAEGFEGARFELMNAWCLPAVAGVP